MKKKSQFLILILVPFCFATYAQNRDRNWVFSDSIGINFNNMSSPQIFSVRPSDEYGENYASISSQSGNLLFYATDCHCGIHLGDYSSLYNSQYNKIANSDSLITHRSETQGIIILPSSLDSSKYFVFYVDNRLYYFDPPDGLYYSIIDVSANSGNGACISKNINIQIDTLTEKLIAVKHANGRDWWLIYHNWNNDAFYILPFINDSIYPVITQHIGLQLSYADGSMGQIVSSNDGSRIAVIFGYTTIINILDFDRCTGTLSNSLSLTTNFPNNYGCSLSSSGRFLYASTMDSLFQFDLSASNVQSSQILIWDDQSDSSEICQQKLAPDGKIYVASTNRYSGDSVFNYTNMNLTVITQPDSLGAACNIQPYSFYLGGHRCLAGLPNIPNYNLAALTGSPCDTLSVSSPAGWPPPNNIEIFPNPNQGEFILRLSSAQADKVYIIIYNTLGEVVYSGYENRTSPKTIISLKLNLSGGLYYVQVRSEKGESFGGRVVIGR